MPWPERAPAVTAAWQRARYHLALRLVLSCFFLFVHVDAGLRIICRPVSAPSDPGDVSSTLPSLVVRVSSEDGGLKLKDLIRTLEADGQGFGMTVASFEVEHDPSLPGTKDPPPPVRGFGTADTKLFQQLMEWYAARFGRNLDLRVAVYLAAPKLRPRLRVLRPNVNASKTDPFYCSDPTACSVKVPLEIGTDNFRLGQDGSLCISIEHFGNLRRQCTDDAKFLNVALNGQGHHSITLSLIEVLDSGTVTPLPPPLGLVQFNVEVLPEGSQRNAGASPKLEYAEVSVDGESSARHRTRAATYKTFVVNLDRNGHLWERAVNELQAKSPFLARNTSLERKSAYDGQSLQFHTLVSQDILTKGEATRIEKDSHNRRAAVQAVTLTKGAVGCALSHIDIWRKAAEASPNELFVVLEDDVRLHYDFDAHFELAMAIVPDDFSVLYLGTQYYANRKAVKTVTGTDKVSLTLEKLTGNNYGTFGYVISPKGASKLLENVFPLKVQVDSYMISKVESGELDAYTVSPPLLTELKMLHKSTVQKL